MEYGSVDHDRHAQERPADGASGSRTPQRRGQSTGMTCGAKLSLVGAVLGFLMLVAGVVVPGLILQKLHQGVVDHVTLKPPSEDSDGYYSWLNNTDESKDPPSYFTVTFFNLTNAADVIGSGADPVVEELPQLTWRRKRVYFNANFSDDLDEVSYNLRYYYEFDQARSDNTSAYQVTNVWPTWLTLLNKAGGTAQHAVAAVSGQLLGALMNPLIGLFGEQASSQWGSLDGIPALQLAPNETLANNTAFEAAVKGQSPAMFAAMREAYADGFFPEFAAWSRNAPFPLTNLRLPGNASRELLITGPCPLFNGTYPLDHPAEYVGLPCAAALQQFAATNVSSAAAQQVFPMGTNSTVIADLRRLAVADYLQTTAQEYLMSLVYPGRANDSGLTLADALWSTRAPEEWLFEFDDPLLRLLRHGDTRANAFNSAFFRSLETDEEALSTDPRRTTTLTGRSDPDRALYYTAWEGEEVLPQRPGGDPTKGGDDAFWCNTALPVHGHDDTQFPISSAGWFSWSPGVKKGENYPIWVPQLFNAANFTYLSKTSVRGIEIDRFHLSHDSLVPLPEFSSTYGGVFNLTCPQGGPPVMLTEPHYYRIDPAFPAAYRVDGVTPPVPDRHDTFIDVDPVSGTALRGYKRLQVNTWLGAGTSGAPNGTKLMPVLWVEQREELTADQAHKYKNTVTFYLDLRRGLLYGLLIGGAVFFLAGVTGVVYHRRRAAGAAAAVGGGREQAGKPLLHSADDRDSSVYI